MLMSINPLTKIAKTLYIPFKMYICNSHIIALKNIVLLVSANPEHIGLNHVSRHHTDVDESVTWCISRAFFVGKYIRSPCQG